jgi:hypothetical protein
MVLWLAHHIHETVIIKEQIPSEWDIGTVQHFTDEEDSYYEQTLRYLQNLVSRFSKPRFTSILSTVLLDHYFLQEYILVYWHAVV